MALFLSRSAKIGFPGDEEESAERLMPLGFAVKSTKI
jgi:hypothetical protein